MTEKFRNKYRIPSARLQNWNYGWNAPYFVTICTQNRECYFGKINNGEMILSDIGELAEKYWIEIPNHFPFVKLDSFVIMPDHVHGIIIIDKPECDGTMTGLTNVATNEETQDFASLRVRIHQNQYPENKFGPQSKNLASIVRGYKIGVTKNARKINARFEWQSRYYDHRSYNNIKKYIIENPVKWGGR